MMVACDMDQNNRFAANLNTSSGLGTNNSSMASGAGFDRFGGSQSAGISSSGQNGAGGGAAVGGGVATQVVGKITSAISGMGKNMGKGMDMNMWMPQSM